MLDEFGVMDMEHLKRKTQLLLKLGDQVCSYHFGLAQCCRCMSSSMP